MGFTPVSIHTQFRSSFSLTMVTSRHLSTFSLQTPPSTNAPSPLVAFCANSNANANAIVNNVLFVAAFSSLQALRNLITQKYENLKSADNISTHVMRRAEVIDLVERVRFEILYLVPRSKRWWGGEVQGQVQGQGLVEFGNVRVQSGVQSARMEMVKTGLPRGAVVKKAVQDGVSQAAIDN